MSVCVERRDLAIAQLELQSAWLEQISLHCCKYIVDD